MELIKEFAPIPFNRVPLIRGHEADEEANKNVKCKPLELISFA
jgi:hypothetical protein